MNDFSAISQFAGVIGAILSMLYKSECWLFDRVSRHPMTKVADQLYEYGCHKGNYGMLNIRCDEQMKDCRGE
jgi:hypothetical protein